MPISRANMAILPKDPLERKSYMMGLQIAGDFGIVIALPVVFFVLIGQWIDERYGVGPWGTVGAFVLAAIISGKMIYQKSKRYAEEYRRLFYQKKITAEDKKSKPEAERPGTDGR